MKKPIEVRKSVINSFLSGEIDKKRAAELLGCTTRTIENYRLVIRNQGESGLVDHRHSNNRRLTKEQIATVVSCKNSDRWRSARNIRDKLNLAVDERTVRRVLVEAGLGRENLERVKPIVRFEANYPNEMWQTDIMGKITFHNIGDLYLIATLDDYSRFVPAGRWFRTQGKMNVFQIWYESLSGWSLPGKIQLCL